MQYPKHIALIPDGNRTWAKEKGKEKLLGKYIPSKKNSMVKDHYKNLGFKFEKEENNIFTWFLEIADYQPKECMIEKGEY